MKGYRDNIFIMIIDECLLYNSNLTNNKAPFYINRFIIPG